MPAEILATRIEALDTEPNMAALFALACPFPQ
jgi:hypothetical protein